MRSRLIGLTMVAHAAIGVLSGVLLVVAIFFVHGVPGWIMLGVAGLLILLGAIYQEWRTYKERSGPSFPGDREYRGR